MRLSKLHGKGIYDENAAKLGEVRDILIDVEKGGVHCLLKEEAEKVFSKDKNSAKTAIKRAIVPYDKVKAMGDIVLVGEKKEEIRSMPHDSIKNRTELICSAV